MEDNLIEIREELNAHPDKPDVQRYRSFGDILAIISTIALSSFYFGYAMVYLPAMDFESIYSLYNI